MKRLLQAYRCRERSAAREQLARWFASPLGRQLEAAESALLAEHLPGLFGYHIVQLGQPGSGDFLASSRIKHRMVTGEAASRTVLPLGYEYLRTRASRLPLASDSTDVVVLPHLLEFEEQPHQVLREVDRILIPEGHVIILGFYPWGMFGLHRLLTGWRKEAPWCGHFYTPLRINDWLSLLGFDTVLLRRYFYLPPVQHQSTLERLARVCLPGCGYRPPISGAYMLMAKKRVATLTPIRPRWRSPRQLMGNGLTEPSTRREIKSDE